ncbi:MAG TPA: DUF6537 domain-containing protein, partial [Azospirillum sp.]|nr:DUF6537 domain-containing protein [Azospirillum sp.]
RPEKFIPADLPKGVTIHPREDLDMVQKELREIPGVTVLIYEQTCATEKRRRRKRGQMEDPKRFAYINDLVCEGCGDCSVASNCLSVEPKETPFGRKRKINLSTCNKDFSCLKGFCPSFVTIEGGQLRKPKPAVKAGVDAALLFQGLPDPVLPSIDERPWSIYITGVGGTGVVTVGALLGMAAHIEGKGVGVLDMTGLAQKGGAVTSHIRIGRTPEDIHSVRIAAGGADAVVACDVVVAAAGDGLSKMAAGRTRAVVNTHELITADFTKQRDLTVPVGDLVGDIAQACGGADRVTAVDATGLATGLLGDSIASNPFMLGYAWQKGLIPLSAEALLKAIELNGAAIEMNRQAFLWGRLAAHDQAAVEAAAVPAESTSTAPIDAQRRLSETLDEMIERRTRFLSEYQDAAYASRYHATVDWTRRVEGQKAPGSTVLTEAVARSLFKLMAYKDEYEVARLYTDTGFFEKLDRMFEGNWKVKFHLSPPVLGQTGEGGTGEPKKREFGPWMRKAMVWLAKGKRLRGTPLDPFGWLPERRMERQLIADFEATVGEMLTKLDRGNLGLAVEIARVPMDIRGYGPVKERNLAAAKAREAELLSAFRAPATPQPMAAE